MAAVVARADDLEGSTPSTSWPAKDIVYVVIVGSIMVAAILEWFLWLSAFIYCLVKAFQKAENTSTKVLAVIVMAFFTAMRVVFLPVMVVTLPLPAQITRHFSEELVSFLQWFAFWAFAGLLTIPWLFCVYQLVTNNVGRKRRIKHILEESTAPKVVIVMPCYKEKPDILLRTVDSIVDCEYPPSCLHVFLSFDGDQEDELYLNTIEKLGVPLTLDSYPTSIDITYRSTRITLSRFPHGGKRHCQKRTFRLIDKVYNEYLKANDNLFVLFIDSDCILDKVCIQNFMYEMELKPGSKQKMLAQTGVITSTTEKNSLITILQDMEYIHGQLFERTVESACGAVTCLPGALTILRFSAFRKMAKYYFADKAEQCQDLFDYGKCHLGEDRWLTHLFMIGAKERYQIQMNTGAFCKTEAVQEYTSLLKQRRRWFLGFITNEVCMLTDIRLWKRYTVLCVVRFAQNTIRTTALLFFIMVLSLITTSQRVDQLPVGFILVSLGLNWALMLYFGARLGRYKIMLYPLMFVVNPFFNWVYMVYGIFTAGQRTWGGPRADAAAADNETTVQEAIERAEANGDDLNVVPETFKEAAAATSKSGMQPQAVPLLPSEHVEGRFASPQRQVDVWYDQISESGVALVDRRELDVEAWPLPRHRRDSFESVVTSSGSNSVSMPRRVESIMDPEDTIHYLENQLTQKPAGGSAFESRPAPVRIQRPSSSKRYSSGSISSTEDLMPDQEKQQQQQRLVTGVFAESSPAPIPKKRPSSLTRFYSGPLPSTEAALVADGKSRKADEIDGITASIQAYCKPGESLQTQSSRLQVPGQAPAPLSPPLAKLQSRDRSSQRIGRSPLSRRSFTLSATDYNPPVSAEPDHDAHQEQDGLETATVSSRRTSSLRASLHGLSRSVDEGRKRLSRSKDSRA